MSGEANDIFAFWPSFPKSSINIRTKYTQNRNFRQIMGCDFYSFGSLNERAFKYEFNRRKPCKNCLTLQFMIYQLGDDHRYSHSLSFMCEML